MNWLEVPEKILQVNLDDLSNTLAPVPKAKQWIIDQSQAKILRPQKYHESLYAQKINGSQVYHRKVL